MSLWIVLLATFALGADDPPTPSPPQPPTRGQFELNLARLTSAQRNAEALALIDLFLTAHPDDAQVLLEGARVACSSADARSAAAYAIRAIRAGLVDDKMLDEDPSLARLRAHEAWEQVRAVRQQLREEAAIARERAATGDPAFRDETIAQQSLREWTARFSKGQYRIETHDELNLVIASDIEREGVDKSIAMLTALSQTLRKSLFAEIQPDRVLLVVATPKDAAAFFENPEHGGLYVHEARRLVARETGATLRHEYTHVLHFGDMQRRRQHHPIWIQEGLATLFEEWRAGANGEPVILSNLRSNEMLDRIRNEKSTAWIDFLALDRPAFMLQPDSNYAQARSMLMFLTVHGKLGAWYALYTAGYDEDPTGRRALEVVLDAPIGRIDGMWKAWVIANGRRDSTIDSGDGVMGVGISGMPDGVRIDSLQPGGPAVTAGLTVGDVLTEIKGQEVRSVADFLLVTAPLRAGENLQVRYRRGKLYSIVRLTLASGHALPPPTTPPQLPDK